MPYIKDYWRNILDEDIRNLSEKVKNMSDNETDFAGILNYTITTLITNVLLSKFDRLRYWHSPLIRGMLLDVAEEFYRRVMVPYEDRQMLNNGDVQQYLDLSKDKK
jgi:hypothetical protein